MNPLCQLHFSKSHHQSKSFLMTSFSCHFRAQAWVFEQMDQISTVTQLLIPLSLCLIQLRWWLCPSLDDEIMIPLESSHDTLNSWFSSLYLIPGSHLVSKTDVFLFIFIRLPLNPEISSRLEAFMTLASVLMWQRKTIPRPPIRTLSLSGLSRAHQV